MTRCREVVEECPSCVAEAEYIERTYDKRADHVCSEMCDFWREQRLGFPEFHRLVHEPEVCEKCGHLFNDRVGHGSYGIKLCRAGCCTIVFCPQCGDEDASWGPVDCPVCGSAGDVTRARLSRMRGSYRRKKATW